MSHLLCSQSEHYVFLFFHNKICKEVNLEPIQSEPNSEPKGKLEELNNILSMTTLRIDKFKVSHMLNLFSNLQYCLKFEYCFVVSYRKHVEV